MVYQVSIIAAPPLTACSAFSAAAAAAAFAAAAAAAAASHAATVASNGVGGVHVSSPSSQNVLPHRNRACNWSRRQEASSGEKNKTTLKLKNCRLAGWLAGWQAGKQAVLRRRHTCCNHDARRARAAARPPPPPPKLRAGRASAARNSTTTTVQGQFVPPRPSEPQEANQTQRAHASRGGT